MSIKDAIDIVEYLDLKERTIGTNLKLWNQPQVVPPSMGEDTEPSMGLSAKMNCINQNPIRVNLEDLYA